MSTVNGSNKQALLAQQLIAGTQKHLANEAELKFEGSTFTPSQVLAQLHALMDLRAAADAARATAKAKVAAERDQLPSLRAFMLALTAFARTRFGNSPDILADFGLKSKKARTPLTADKRLAANVKRAATRKARGPIGKRNRAAVKGDVTGVVVTPVTTAPPVQPASNATSGGHATK
jgi:hypothetical protein